MKNGNWKNRNKNKKKQVQHPKWRRLHFISRSPGEPGVLPVRTQRHHRHEIRVVICLLLFQYTTRTTITTTTTAIRTVTFVVRLYHQRTVRMGNKNKYREKNKIKITTAIKKNNKTTLLP